MKMPYQHFRLFFKILTPGYFFHYLERDRERDRERERETDGERNIDMRETFDWLPSI